jgi:hypothetical protein
MSRLLAALAATALGLVISWTLYVYTVGSIGPVELLEVLLLTIPISMTLYRIGRSLLLRPSRPRPTPRRADTAPRPR